MAVIALFFFFLFCAVFGPIGDAQSPFTFDMASVVSFVLEFG